MTPQTFSGGWKKLGECRVLQCADDDHPAGTTEEAGLPNITGNLNNALQTFSWSSTITAGSGAVQATAVGTDTAGTHGSGYGGVWMSFDASKSNEIYGKSDTVQMKSIYCNIWQRIS